MYIQHKVQPQDESENLKRLLDNAVKSGEIINFQHIKIFLTGSSAAGKTSLRRSLFRDDFVADYNSTILQETKHAYVVLKSKDDKVEWRELTAQQQIDLFKSLLSKLPTEKHAKKSDVSHDATSSKTKISRNYEAPVTLIKKLDASDGLESEILRIPDPVQMITVIDTGGQPEFIHMLPAIVNCPTINFVVFNMTKKLTDKVEVYYKKGIKQKEEGMAMGEKKIKVEIQCEVEEKDRLKKGDKVEVIHHKAKSNERSKDEVKKGEVKLEVDYKVKQDDEVKEDKMQVEVHYKENEDKIPLSCLDYTYEDLIKLLMSVTIDSVDRPAIQEEDNLKVDTLNSGLKSTKQEYRIGFVGTHKDKLIKPEIVIRDLNDHLATLVSEQIVEKILDEDGKQYLYPVNNKASGRSENEDEEISKIRKRIERVANGMKTKIVPITWMILEIRVKEFCEVNSKHYITLEKFSKIARTEAAIESSKDVDSVLNYFHLLGIFLHFNFKCKDFPDIQMQEYVITDHQWFYKTLCNVVGVLSDKPTSANYKRADKFKETGLLRKEEFSNMEWNEGIKIDFFLGLLLRWKIIAVCGEDYFIPYVLPYCQYYFDKYKYLLVEPLLVRFSSGFLPRGFFCSLVVDLLQRLPAYWYKVYYSQNYRNVITFRVDDEEDNFFLRLQDKIYYLEIQVRHDKDCNKRCVNKEFDIIRRFLHSVCDNLNLDPDKLEYGFICNDDSEGDSKVDHMVVLDSNLQNPKLKHCSKCMKSSKMGPLHKLWFDEVSSYPLM